MVTSERVEECGNCNEGALVCSRCGGIGFVSSIVGSWETVHKCDLCSGKGYWPCSLCFTTRTQKIATRIRQNIKAFGLSNREKEHIISVFDNLYNNKEIRNHIEHAQIRSVLERKNRHDLYHALLVTDNAVKLFKYMCLPKNSAPFPPSFSLYSSLEVVLISAFCHDIKRGFPNHAKRAAIAMKETVNELYKDTGILNGTKITDAVESCIYYHSGEENLPTNIEDTIVTLADGLDCGRHRVQSFFPVSKVVSEDKCPMEYFSNRGINKVDFYPTDNHIVEFVFHICDEAGLQKAFDLRQRIENTMLELPKNKKNFVLKAIYPNCKLNGWKSDTMQIWPRNR